MKSQLSNELGGEKRRGSNRPAARGKSLSSEVSEARRLLAIIERSQVPLGESAPVFAELKVKIDNGEMLIVDEYEDLRRLVRMAKDWERGVESSSSTEREETLAG